MTTYSFGEIKINENLRVLLMTKKLLDKQTYSWESKLMAEQRQYFLDFKHVFKMLKFLCFTKLLFYQVIILNIIIVWCMVNLILLIYFFMWQYKVLNDKFDVSVYYMIDDVCDKM